MRGESHLPRYCSQCSIEVDPSDLAHPGCPECDREDLPVL